MTVQNKNFFQNSFTALKATGTDEIWFSSTTSERYCTESPTVIESIYADEKNVDEKHTNLQFPTAKELYEIICEEIKSALKVVQFVFIIGMEIHIYLMKHDNFSIFLLKKII